MLAAAAPIRYQRMGVESQKLEHGSNGSDGYGRCADFSWQNSGLHDWGNSRLVLAASIRYLSVRSVKSVFVFGCCWRCRSNPSATRGQY
jgi:hypothetical protein